MYKKKKENIAKINRVVMNWPLAVVPSISSIPTTPNGPTSPPPHP
jgi:hypothetical protein